MDFTAHSLPRAPVVVEWELDTWQVESWWSPGERYVLHFARFCNTCG